MIMEKKDKVKGCSQSSSNATSLEEDIVQEYFRAVEGGDVGKVEEQLRKEPSLVHCSLDLVQGNGHSHSLRQSGLHVVADRDDVKLAQLLVAQGADLLARTSSGATAIHSGAAAGSIQVLRYLLSVDSGALNLLDHEGATALHLAVKKKQGESVRTLLELGASINLAMFDGSTPLHLAAALGFYDVTQVFFDVKPMESRAVVLAARDAQGMTVAHRAAMFNHWNLLSWLITQKCPVNAVDNKGRSVLVLAAERGAWDAVSELLHGAADPLILSNDGKNFLHQVVALGGDPQIFKEDMQQNGDFTLVLKGRDLGGYTPLHYAAQYGFGRCCSTLIKLGALVSAKGHDLMSPLHMAAQHGRSNTVKLLLAYETGQQSINDADHFGRTALHLAAENGHQKVTVLLLSKGAQLLRDVSGCTPLHLAAVHNQTGIMEHFISRHATQLALVDNGGNTVLHLAAKHDSAQVFTMLLDAGLPLTFNDQQLSALDLAILNDAHSTMTALVDNPRWKEALLQPSSLYACSGLVDKFPDVMLRALDRCQTTEEKASSTGRRSWIRHDYQLLQPSVEAQADDQLWRTSWRGRKDPLMLLNRMVACRRVELLCHPVCTSYLEGKWLAYGLMFQVVRLSLYVTFLTLLTYLILEGIEMDLRPHLRQVSLQRLSKYRPDLVGGNRTRFGPLQLTVQQGGVTAIDQTLLAFVLAFALFHLLQKVAQCLRQGLLYFVRLRSMFEVTLYASTMLFSIGFYDVQDDYMSWQSQWLLGAVAIFFAWSNLFFLLQWYGQLSIHVLVLLRVMKTLTEAMMVFFVVIVAFAITFYTLYPAKILPDDPLFYQRDHGDDSLGDIYFSSYSSLQTAILRVSDQMIGDADVIVNFISPIYNGFMYFPTLTYMLALTSILVVTILLQAVVVSDLAIPCRLCLLRSCQCGGWLSIPWL
ncbi:hypothetical protein RvY_18970 [Ramazzottius varieornatus]|uniref:Uncharacterized protein n=1 Tax=Ramazzottius varieornatus TaxID=947166 RepID=A0A1D1W924_RAMVA|nr:hypothetical protein RvY_18970 [Ramazzottius varieornatus]